LHNKKLKVMLLDYERLAGQLHGRKQISAATYELKGNGATMKMARPGEKPFQISMHKSTSRRRQHRQSQ
jgi:hypothetical protein